MCEEDPLIAYLFDSAVVTFGRTIENHLEEIVNVGNDANPKMESKYKLSDVLSKGFKFPTERSKKSSISGSGKDQFSIGIQNILALAEQNTKGIKRWEYKPN